MYTIEELIENPSFRRMAKGTASPEEVNTWSKWIEESDENRQKAKIAARRVAGFRFKDPDLPDMKKKWSELYATTIAEQEWETGSVRSNSTSTLNWFFRVAAVLALVSVVSMGIYELYEDTRQATQLEEVTEVKQVTTGEGEQISLQFSNGARIMVNGNSTLTYRLDLLRGETIQVSLDGEAYFESGEKSGQQERVFSITTPFGMIEDVGTSFVVSVENSLSRVVLREGLVEIRTKADNTVTSRFIAQEGEMVEFSESNLIRREQVNTTFYTSWATGSMEFDQTEIREFAQFVEQRFNVTVQITDQELSEIKIHGAIYYKTLSELVGTVSDITEVPMYQSRDGDTVYVGNRLYQSE